MTFSPGRDYYNWVKQTDLERSEIYVTYTKFICELKKDEDKCIPIDFKSGETEEEIKVWSLILNSGCTEGVNSQPSSWGLYGLKTNAGRSSCFVMNFFNSLLLGTDNTINKALLWEYWWQKFIWSAWERNNLKTKQQNTVWMLATIPTCHDIYKNLLQNKYHEVWI